MHFATIRMIEGGVEESASPVTSSVGTLILVRVCAVIRKLFAWWRPWRLVAWSASLSQALRPLGLAAIYEQLNSRYQRGIWFHCLGQIDWALFQILPLRIPAWLLVIAKLRILLG